MKFATSLKSLRLKHGYTQGQLAHMLNVAKSTVSMYEGGERTPPPDMLEKIADIFNVDINVLFGREPEPTPITSNAVLLSPERTYNTADLSPQKQEIQTALDAMTPEQLEQIYSYIQFIKSQKK